MDLDIFDGLLQPSRLEIVDGLPEDRPFFSKRGEIATRLDSGSLYFAVDDSDDVTDADGAGWNDPAAALTLKLTVHYFDKGTAQLRIGYTTDGATETTALITTKTNTLTWKKATLTLSNVLLATDVYGIDENDTVGAGGDHYNASFRIYSTGPVYLSSIALKNTATDASLRFPAFSYLNESNIIPPGNWDIGVEDAWTISADNGKVKLNSQVPSISLGESVASATSGFDTGKGIWMGKYASNDWRLRVGDPTGTNPYFGFDNTDLTLRSAGIEVYDGATQTGNIAKSGAGWFGSSSSAKSLQWWTTGGTAGDVQLGGSGASVYWDDSVAKLIISGSTDITGTLTVTGNVVSEDFSAGVSGWRIRGATATSSLEIQNIIARGRIEAAVFVKSMISAHAGTAQWSKSAGKLDADMSVPGSGTWTMTLDDPPDTGWLFDNNDICQIKETQGASSETWFTVQRGSQSGGQQTYTCTYASGTRPATYHKGNIVTDLGVSGQGVIMLSADQSNAPWISIRTHAGSPWTTQTERVRLGKLNGITDATFGALSGYGLWTDNIYLTGSINATAGTISGVLSIGASGGFYQGTGTFASPTTGLKIYNSGGVGLLEMWGSGTKQVYFNSSGQLVAAAGNFTVDNAGVVFAQGVSTNNQIRWMDGANEAGHIVTYTDANDAGMLISVNDAIAPKTNGYISIDVFDNANESTSFLMYKTPTQAWASFESSTSLTGVIIGGGGPPSALLHLSSTAPTTLWRDTTASAKSLLLTVNANTAQFEEVGGAANDLFVLDLANARVGIGTASPLTPLHVGSGSANNSTDAMILISRSVSSGAANSHAFSDSTNFSNAPYAYNSFDARINITGTGALNHYAGFQVGAEYNNSNTLGAFYGFFSRPTMTQGTITALYHAYAGDPTYTAGTITAQYGLYIENLTRGSTNYAIYTAGTTASIFGGAVTINGNLVAGATGTTPSLIVGNQTSNSTSSTFIQKAKSSGATALSATWDLTTGGLYNLSTQSVSNLLSFNTVNGDIAFAEGVDFVLGTSTGTKWGTATSQKQGWWNATPVVQQADVGANDGTLASVATQANAMRTLLRTIGMMA